MDCAKVVTRREMGDPQAQEYGGSSGQGLHHDDLVDTLGTQLVPLFLVLRNLHLGSGGRECPREADQDNILVSYVVGEVESSRRPRGLVDLDGWELGADGDGHGPGMTSQRGATHRGAACDAAHLAQHGDEE